MLILKARLQILGGFGLMLLAALAVGSSAANAAPPSATASTTVNATISSVLSVSGVTTPITLSGAPNTTVGPVSGGFTVLTNDPAGYGVVIQANAAAMTGARTGNTDTIPIANLSAAPVGGGTYTAMSNTTPLTLYTKTSASAAAGDASQFNLQLAIPFRSADTYSVGLTYSVTGS